MSKKALFVSAGRRVEMARSWKKKNWNLSFYELSKDVPVSNLADTIIVGKKFNDTDFEDHISDIINHNNYDVVIPFMDSAVVSLSKLKDNKVFDRNLLVSNFIPSIICYDKALFATFILDSFPTLYPEKVDGKYPIIYKPRFGHGSNGVIIAKNPLDELYINKNSYIAQDYIDGSEYSVDIYLSLETTYATGVARKRLRVGAGGEVISSQIVNNKALVDLAINVAQTLGIVGPCNIQFIVNDANIYIIEINPRFGGGYTFSMAAGLDVINLIECDLWGYAFSTLDYNYGLRLERAMEDFYFS